MGRKYYIDPVSGEKIYIRDRVQGLADRVKQYKRMRYTNEDGTQGFAMYKVEPMQGEYVGIADWDEFCRVNKVLAD